MNILLIPGLVVITTAIEIRKNTSFVMANAPSPTATRAQSRLVSSGVGLSSFSGGCTTEKTRTRTPLEIANAVPAGWKPMSHSIHPEIRQATDASNSKILIFFPYRYSLCAIIIVIYTTQYFVGIWKAFKDEVNKHLSTTASLHRSAWHVLISICCG